MNVRPTKPYGEAHLQQSARESNSGKLGQFARFSRRLVELPGPKMHERDTLRKANTNPENETNVD